jgi:hypothetical protein
MLGGKIYEPGIEASMDGHVDGDADRIGIAAARG